jgi:hypothetical protein
MLRDRTPYPFLPLRCFGSRAASTVQPTAPIYHRRALAERTAPCLRAAPGSFREIAGRIPVFQPTAPLFMGSLFASHFYPPLQSRSFVMMSLYADLISSGIGIGSSFLPPIGDSGRAYRNRGRRPRCRSGALSRNSAKHPGCGLTITVTAGVSTITFSRLMR